MTKLLASIASITCIVVFCLLAAAFDNAHAVNDGPFGHGGTPGGECAQLAPGRVLSYGFEEFRNTGPSTATISKVGLANARGLRITAGYIVPITGHELYGVRVGYPPAAHLASGVGWAQRQRALGARIPPSHGRQTNNILLVLKPTASIGTARGVDVFYRESGHTYHLRTATQIMVAVGRSCPSG